MSTTTDFEQISEQINALSEVIYPNMPVDVYCQEAEALYHTAMADKEQLLARGLKLAVIKALPVAAGACRYAEALWSKERHEKQEAEERWVKESPAAYQLRNTLLAEFSFAFEGNQALQTKLDYIRRGDSHADMIQDLISLKVLGKDNPQPLEATKFDFALLDEAEVSSDAMADILGRATGTREESSAAKLTRDKAYTYLKQFVDEVRRYGKFVFRTNADHAAKYASEYRRNN